MLCNCGSKKERFPLHDAAGIFCTFVCEDCEEDKRKKFNPVMMKEIGKMFTKKIHVFFDDGNYYWNYPSKKPNAEINLFWYLFLTFDNFINTKAQVKLCRLHNEYCDKMES